MRETRSECATIRGMIPVNPVLTPEKTLRSLRMVYFMMFAAMFFYMGMAEYMRSGQKADPVDPAMLKSFLILCGIEAAVLIGIRKKMVEPSLDAIGRDPNDQAMLRRWMQGSMVCFAIASSIALFGFVLRFMGATMLQASVLYGLAIVMMFLSAPQRPQ